MAKIEPQILPATNLTCNLENQHCANRIGANHRKCVNLSERLLMMPIVGGC